MRATLAAILITMAACTPAEADARPAVPTRDEVTRAVIFKDGHALVVRSVKGVADAEGRLHTEAVSDRAVLGTVWAFSEGRELLGLHSSWDEREEDLTREDTCASVPELLRANEGRKVRLHLDQETLEGRLSGLLERSAEGPQRPGDGKTPGTWRIPVEGGQHVVVDGDQGERTVIAVKDVRRVSGPELSTRCLLTERRVTRDKRLVFELGEAAAGKPANLTLMYFTAGLRWIPSYRISLGDGDAADIALQGEIVNDAEELGTARVQLVVGVPNFRFKDTLSPMTLEFAMRQAVAEYAPHLATQMSNALEVRRWSGQATQPPAGAPEPPKDMLADAGQDTHVFEVATVRVAKGARALVPLWRRTVKARHLYTLDLQAGTGTYRNGPLHLEQNQVWHQIELENDAKIPWTTGSALVLRDGMPLGQELLAYTPGGGRVLIPVTVAINIRASLSERETARLGTLRWDGNTYAKVRRGGQLELRSHVDAPVDVLVRVNTAGRVTQAEGAQIELQAAGGPHNTSRLEWRLELPAGGTKRLDYEVLAYEG